EIMYNLYHCNYYLACFIKKIAKLTNSFTDRKDEKQYEFAQEIYQGYGACYILSPVFFQHFNDLWAPTFLMHEELFLSKQLESKGFRIYYEPSIRIQHHWHAAMDKVPNKKRWEMSRDAHQIYRKYISLENTERKA
ncbi:MAG: glycosyltransferase family 2 protein, partial [Desulfobacteraceae bacterium]